MGCAKPCMCSSSGSRSNTAEPPGPAPDAAPLPECGNPCVGPACPSPEGRQRVPTHRSALPGPQSRPIEQVSQLGTKHASRNDSSTRWPAHRNRHRTLCSSDSHIAGIANFASGSHLVGQGSVFILTLKKKEHTIKSVCNRGHLSTIEDTTSTGESK